MKCSDKYERNTYISVYLYLYMYIYDRYERYEKECTHSHLYICVFVSAILFKIPLVTCGI